MAQQWDRVLEHTGRVIQVYPGSFPRAYSLNAWAHLRLQHFELAEKSAMEGIRLDDERHHPELEFVAGMALLAKHDRKGATKHFEAYLALAPRGVDAAPAQKQLASLRSDRWWGRSRGNWLFAVFCGLRDLP